MHVHEKLLMWRADTAGIGEQFKGVVGLVSPGAPLEPHEADVVAAGVLNFVATTLTDSDVLNKDEEMPRANSADGHVISNSPRENAFQTEAAMLRARLGELT